MEIKFILMDFFSSSTNTTIERRSQKSPSIVSMSQQESKSLGSMSSKSPFSLSRQGTLRSSHSRKNSNTLTLNTGKSKKTCSCSISILFIFYLCKPAFKTSQWNTMYHNISKNNNVFLMIYLNIEVTIILLFTMCYN